ncbi:MAG: formyltetrahydrofolate deformylase [Hyphomicrobiales bacterium]
MSNYVLTLSCKDRPGIVAAVATFLAGSGCNIIESAQFGDTGTGLFFMRVVFASEGGAGLGELQQGFAPVSARFEMSAAIHDLATRARVLVMVSKFGHCLNDLIYRWKIDALPIDIPAVVSNHTDFRDLTEAAGLNFVHIPVTRATKAEGEAALLDLVAREGIDLVVLARYMQVLSDDACRRLEGRVINIHHSFLPSFKGAMPYHQAHARGVKLIGATAHYVTADLDEGPIIEQDVARVNHAASPADMVAIGRDVEAQVLARAIKYHVEHRVFVNDSRTVIFT